MIGHIEHGSDFGGLFRYLLAEDKGSRIIGGLAAGKTALELTQEFNNCADQRRTTTKPVKHLIISFAPDDGKISDEAKVRIATEAVERLGYTYNQYVVVDHHRDDPGHDWKHDHDHIHIAVNMITLDGKRVDDWQDKTKFEEILRQLEIEEKLTQVTSSKARKFKALSHGQIQRVKREFKEFKQGNRTEFSEIPLMIKLQAAIERASVDRPDLTTFIARLQNWNIDVWASISDKGRKRISYQIGDLKVKGSKLHNGSFPKLISQRGIDFNLDRDLPAMEASMSGKQVTIPQPRLIEWTKINLEDYLPSGLKNDFQPTQTPVTFERRKSSHNFSDEEIPLVPKHPNPNEVREDWQEFQPSESTKKILEACNEIFKANNERILINNKISEFQIAENHGYLESLGIKANILSSDRFYGTVFVDKNNNAIFLHQDQQGFTGFEGINYEYKPN